MDRKRPSVLLVEADEAERGRLADALVRHGCDVVLCSGPTGPDYTCIGGREGRCPLVDPADVVVLDLWLESDTVFMGTPAAELLNLYRSAGKPVIALGAPTGSVDMYGGEPVTRLDRWPDAGVLVAAVDEAFAVE